MTVKKTLLYVFAGMACFFLLMVGSCGYLIYRTYQQGNTEITPRIDILFQAIDDQNFGTTYLTETTSGLRNETTREEYVRLGEIIYSQLGKLKSKTMTDFKYRFLSSGTFYDATYDAYFEKGSGMIYARLMKVDSSWKIHMFRVESPLLIQDYRSTVCQSCGEDHSLDAKFCPHCGAERESKEATSEEELGVDTI